MSLKKVVYRECLLTEYMGHKDKMVGPYKEAEKFSYVPKNGYRLEGLALNYTAGYSALLPCHYRVTF